MYSLAGALKRYPWGSTDAIPALLGTEPDGTPWAEYWLGAHPDGPATTSDGRRLDDVISERPASLGAGSRAAFGDRLPFLVKLLSAASPLSIQAHPTRAQAEAGHARENAEGMAPGSPLRSFRDDWPKPEVIIALDTFDALVGFRQPAETARLLGAIGVESLAPVVAILAQAVPTAPSTREAFLAVVATATAAMVEDLAAALDGARAVDEAQAEFQETARLLTGTYPHDPSVLVALMLNRARLAPWEAIFVPAGTMHAYLRGTGVEVMGASDNVVRGGLTGKHVDLPVLVEIGDFQPADPTILTPQDEAPGLRSYATGAPEFGVRLVRADGPSIDLPGQDRARLVLGLSGELTVQGTESTGAITVRRGDAVLSEAGEPVSVDGEGEAVLVSSAHDRPAPADPADSSDPARRA